MARAHGDPRGRGTLIAWLHVGRERKERGKEREGKERGVTAHTRLDGMRVPVDAGWRCPSLYVIDYSIRERHHSPL